MNIKYFSRRLLLFVLLAAITIGSLALSTPTAQCQGCSSCVTACHNDAHQLYLDCMGTFGEQAFQLCSEWSQEYFQSCVCRNCWPIGCCPACTTQECEDY